VLVYINVLLYFLAMLPDITAPQRELYQYLLIFYIFIGKACYSIGAKVDNDDSCINQAILPVL